MGTIINRTPASWHAAAATDGELLQRYVADRDEAAFTALVRRHGPMVLGVCRRVAADPHDADDAFQATFLILVRKAATLRRPDALGPWLHGVAVRTAKAARRRARHRGLDSTADVPAPMPPPAVAADERAGIDEELARLPTGYRSAVILCDMEGRTRRAVARQLGLADGALSDRLTAARQMLARRLTRRGVTLGTAALTATLAPAARPAEAAALAPNLAAPPAAAAALAKGVLHAMFLRKLLLTGGVLAGLAVATAGALAAFRPAATTPSPTIPNPQAAAGKPQDNPKPPAYPTRKALIERDIGVQRFALLPGVKVKAAQGEATVDMVFATGNPRSALPAAVVKKIGAPIVGRVDITKEDHTRASLGLSFVNPKDQTVFDIARIDAWDLGVGPPGKEFDVLVIESDQPGFGVIGRDWMRASVRGTEGLIHTPWMIYYGRAR
jgi:RNA polymerase sigma factor (sigma-70 family)